MSWREITVERLLALKEALVVDVRSPCEHASERIPGSFNIPLLTDQERAIVGTLYAEQGEVAARILALRIISPKIPEIVDAVLALRGKGVSIVIHCWRGGLRSEAVASFLSVVGVDCWRLIGGYKAWRKHVLQDFSADGYRFAPIVLHGRTGTGKTEILQHLQKCDFHVLDLESLCHHRGSIFGGFGLGEQPTQKNFEGLLWQSLRRFDNQPVFLEAESRRVGKLALPDFLLHKIERGRRILVTGSLPRRIARLTGDYASIVNGDDWQRALQALELLKENLGKANLLKIKEFGRTGDVEAIVEALLVTHYDPLYDRHISKCSPYELTVDGDDPLKAAETVASWLQISFSAKKT